MKKRFAITALGLISAVLTVHAGDAMKAFPPSGKGMVRYVLQLPKHDDESAFKVQLIVGKTVLPAGASPKSPFSPAAAG